MSLQQAAITFAASRTVTSFIDLIFALFSLSLLERISSSASDSSAEFYASCLLILLEKIFRSTSATVSLSVSAISVRNGGRRTAFLDAQSRSFFYFDSSSAAVRRRTSVFGRRILSPSPEKACSLSIDTMV